MKKKYLAQYSQNTQELLKNWVHINALNKNQNFVILEYDLKKHIAQYRKYQLTENNTFHELHDVLPSPQTQYYDITKQTFLPKNSANPNNQFRVDYSSKYSVDIIHENGMTRNLTRFILPEIAFMNFMSSPTEGFSVTHNKECVVEKSKLQTLNYETYLMWLNRADILTPSRHDLLPYKTLSCSATTSEWRVE